MNRSLTARIMELLQRRQLKGMLAKIALTLSCIAIFLITYMLVAPVLTQEWEPICGMDEHSHTEDCYEDVLVCEMGEAETVGHVHNDDCYELRMEETLVCGQEEGDGGHTHSDSCYTGGETVLTCTKPTEGHVHTEDCYTVEVVTKYKTVTEDITETVTVEDTKTIETTDEEGNVITETVVTGSHEETIVVGTQEVQVEDGTEEVRTLTCTEPTEGHVHTDACYTTTERTLVCAKEETPSHKHTEACYELREVPVLICTEEGTTCHEHSESCYERRLICGMEEHTHSDLCYQAAEEEGPGYICGFLTEHTHGEDCYFESGELKCTIPEHIHDESCLPAQEPVRADRPIFPETLPEGYMEANVYQFNTAMFAGSDETQTVEESISALVYIPMDAFEEEVVFVPQLLFEEDEAYTAAAEALAQTGTEYSGMTAMDLSFIGVESYEQLEPNTGNGPVYVRLTMPETLPEETELTLWHYTGYGAEMVENYYYECVDGTLTVDFMTDSFSTYALTVSAAPQTGSNPVSWGTTSPSVEPVAENGATTWNVSSINYRYVDIPVSINVSGLQNATTVTLPLVLDIGEAGRNGYKPAYKETGNTGDGWTVVPDQNTDTVTITINKTVSGHESIDIYYRFDCWNVVSDKQFTIQCTVANGGEGRGESKNYTLTGCVKTGNGGTIIPYATEWDESIYSFNGFGGADKKGAYVLAWSDVYKTYFGLEQSAFDNANYIYDIAAYEVEPKGQQPYSISGTFTPDQNGELISAVYMMDSAGDQAAEGALCLKSIDSSSGFVITGNNFTIANSSLTKVVSSLEDETDHKTYTLYFLVRYPRSTLMGYEDVKDWEGKVIDKKVRLNATLNLTHTGIDSQVPTTISEQAEFCCYDGASKVDVRTYWATYYSTAVNSSAGLTMLKGGNTATVEYSADFFSLNEARTDTNARTMVAIIDLSYVTNNGKQQLNVGDYRFSGFNLSLIDAPGSWSQNTTNTPNVGWTPDQYGSPKSDNLGNIRVYGSTSLTGGNWIELASVPAASVWALDQNRAFRGNFTPITGEYVRLKVEYDSQFTTALRVAYQMELKPSIVEKYNLRDVETLNLTNWFNYGAYKSVDGAKSADLTDFVFQRYPVDDSAPTWTNYDGTIKEVREYDNASGPTSGLPGYNLNKESWDVGYSLRGFARTTLGSSADVAGMMVTQALYDSDGNLVGNPTSIDPVANDSYSLKTEVANVSEIVYNISGAVTSGASSLGDLQERINRAGADSPYKSLTMRYYVLLPAGLKLNTNPDNGEADENGAPKYHFWTEGTTEYLSANSAFYNNNSNKVVQGGQTDVPVSNANIPGWKRLSANSNLSEMYWVAGGAVTHDTEASGGQLVVFERTLGNGADYDRFNMWGDPETYFWGRGLSFSVVPEKGTGSLPAGSYTPQFWCQFLDGNGNPISLEGFAKVDDVKADQVGQPADTLLYIPSTFVNKHHVGSSGGEIGVEIDTDSSITLEDGTTAVKPEGDYSYPLTYKVETGSSTDVVLWCNVEDIQYYGVRSEWRGTVAGVDLGNTNAKVYVRTDTFSAKDYVNDNAGKDKLTDKNGWTLVENLGTCDWSKVKAIAFYFEGRTFKAGDSATVHINMKAPKDDTFTINGQPKDPSKTVYTAYNELLISDTHKEDDKDTSNKSACYFVNYVEVPMKVTPVSYQLPSTGGSGTEIVFTTGMAFFLAVACLMYQTLRRSRKTGEGGTA